MATSDTHHAYLYAWKHLYSPKPTKHEKKNNDCQSD